MAGIGMVRWEWPSAVPALRGRRWAQMGRAIVVVLAQHGKRAVPPCLALTHLNQERAQRVFADVPPAGDEPALNRAFAAHTGDVVGAETDFSCGLPGGNEGGAVKDANSGGGDI